MGLGLLAVASAALGAAVGSTVIDLPAALWELLDGEATSPDARILLHVRLPRVCASLLCGSALAVSGMLIQAVLSNPLASPNVIGVNAGAGFCTFLAMALAPGMAGAAPFGRLYRGPVRHFDRIRRGGGGRRGQADHHPGGGGGEQHLHRGHQHHQDLFPGHPLQRQHLFDWGLLRGELRKPLPRLADDSAGPGAGLPAGPAHGRALPGRRPPHSLGLPVKATRFGLILIACVLAGRR